MAETAKKLMTVEEFFVWQRTQDERYELVDGFPVMMTGASNFHDVIVGNIIAALHPQVRGSGCWIATADTATRTRLRASGDPMSPLLLEPQARVLRSGGSAPDRRGALSSNVGIPWQRKLDEYWRLPSLRYLLLVDSLVVAATLYTRTATEWDPADADGLEAVLVMPEIGCRLAMRDVYEGWICRRPRSRAERSRRLRTYSAPAAPRRTCGSGPRAGRRSALTLVLATPGTEATAFSTQTGISPATGQPGAVSVISTARCGRRRCRSCRSGPARRCRRGSRDRRRS